MSSAQTREKINDRSIGEWRRYEDKLASMHSKVSRW
jgi:hypothetical protein